MTWDSKNIMELRLEFVTFATQQGANRRALCRQYGISAKTGYKWIRRYEQGDTALVDRCRRPMHSPSRTAAEVEARVVELRQARPAWGAPKIARRISDLGCDRTPSPSTVTRILHRHGLISAESSTAALPWQRFEHAHPNDLWQMDFKGGIELDSGARCAPFTVLDDHSRFDLALDACGSTPTRVVREHLRAVFRRYGLPLRINADNGPPWGSPARSGQLTALAIWLIRLGIRISYSRPRHPQTNGKDERFHRTLKAELLAGRRFKNLKSAQQAFYVSRMSSVYTTLLSSSEYQEKTFVRPTFAHRSEHFRSDLHCRLRSPIAARVASKDKSGGCSNAASRCRSNR
ncbi:hypothetical protein BURKHO8Y_170370 [Burkholderia sp. 8Y]|nr:hypothetical protein BURKHO8Y_170370 [Burkholderia sp. 8Y]